MTTDKEKLLAFANSLEWQDISTAPKDGTDILAYNPTTGWQQTRWTTRLPATKAHPKGRVLENGGEWVIYYQNGMIGVWYLYPTHWMPLPTEQAEAALRAIGLMKEGE